MDWIKRLLVLWFCGVLVACGGAKVLVYGGFDSGRILSRFRLIFFTSTAPLAPPSLSQSFTERLKDIFLNQTSLSLKTTEGDLQFNGSITGYEVRPVAIQGNEVAAKNRLTITVRVNYVNTKDDKTNFDKSFSRFFDFDNTQDLAAVQDELIRQINEQLAQDIFNASVGNW